ncbi:hypothetical protein D3C78_913570 [compost metagenome]
MSHRGRHGLRIVDIGFERIIERLGCRAVHAGTGRARGDVEHTDPGVRQLSAQGFGEPAQGKLGGAVTGVAWVANGAIGRTDVDHHGTVGLLEQRQHQFCQAHRRTDVHREHRIDLTVVELFEHGEMVDPGGIDQQVDAADVLGPRQHLAAVGEQRQVCTDPTQIIGVKLEQRHQGLPMASHGQHLGTTGAQCSGDGQADATAGTGQHDAGFRQAHAGSPRYAASHETYRCRAGTPLWRHE